MTSLSTLIRLELSKSYRRPMTWILGVIFVGFLGFMYTVLTLASFVVDVQDAEGADMAGLEEQIMLPDGLAFGSALVVGVGAVVVIVFAAGLFGSEFGWATIRMMLLMRAGRPQLVVAKLILLVIMSFVTALVGIGISLAGTIGAEMVIGDPGDISGHLTASFFRDAVLITLRSTIAIAMWGLIAGILALAFSSLAIGTGIALAGYFIGDLIVSLIAQAGTVGEWFNRLMPTYGINGMVMLNQVTPPDYSNAEIVGMVASLIVWAAVFIAFGLYRFRNMDVVAASS